jgi:hypothetical protein
VHLPGRRPNASGNQAAVNPRLAADFLAGTHFARAYNAGSFPRSWALAGGVAWLLVRSFGLITSA